MTASRTRSRWLLPALGLTLIASLWAVVGDGDASSDLLANAERSSRPAPRSPSPVVVADASGARPPTPSVTATAASASGSGVAPLPLALPQRRELDVQRNDLFAAYGPGLPPPPIKPQAVRSTLTEAPPPPPPLTLPFVYAGRLVTAQTASVLLQEGERTLVLTVGESDGAFRLDQDMGSALQFTHLPTGQTLTLAVAP